VQPRAALRIHTIGNRGDLFDDGGHFERAYATSPGDWVLIRPDGYIGAMVTSEELSSLDKYWRSSPDRTA
jgi:hypothetical protein